MRHSSPLIAAIAAMTLSATVHAQVLNDPLQGSTTGTRENGAFVAGGWQVTNQYDTIYWHVPTLSHGSFEYDVKGLPGGSCPGGAGFKNELSHMYDWTFGSADTVYTPGYRDNPYKHFIRKQCESGKMDTLEVVYAIPGPPADNFFEIDTGALSYNSNTTYHWKTEWENTGGVSILTISRDAAVTFQGQIFNSWNPAGQSVRIAASPRRADEGANVGAIYSNVKVFDLTSFVPNAPTISVPANGETVNTPVSYVQWTGDSHSIYQVRVNTSNDPNTGTVWDSQQVSSSRYFTWTGTLSNGTYYLFARLGTASGMGPWSTTGRTFTVNTSFVPGGIDYVTVKGNSYANNSGPFLGLGFTYMRALYNCKFQRTRFTSDCAYMASKGYTYLRDLTMVSWDDLEIAPVSFTNPVGQFVPAWSDYWQQFKDSIDVAYSNGLKTEVTIFAAAQDVMPSDSTRTTHLNNILANIVGREHKIVLLEIANEHYQNGLPDINDVRNKAAYLAANTPIPVSLSSPADTSDSGILGMYSGSAADLTMVHFSRDIGTQEGGWLPVRDSYRTIGGVAPLSSNEPIGAGSSVNTENDPIKLCMAACFGFTANLTSYVYHSRAGVFGWELCCPPGGAERFFNASPGNDSYVNILPILPKELSSWEKNDGKASASPFTSYSMGQANKWWTEVGGSTNGCVRNISAIKSGRFVTTAIGILGGGLELEARRPMAFKVYNPLTANIDYNLTKNPGDHFTLAQGTGAYVIIGDFTDVPLDGGGSGGTNSQIKTDLGTVNVENGLTHPQPGDGDTVAANIGGRDCRRNVTAGADNYFYFAVNDGYAFNGNKPNHWIRFDYYDTGTGTATLEYDGASAAYTNGGTITYTNTNTWKTATLNVVDAYFGNRQNNGADFRLARGVTFYLDTVYVYAKAFSGTAIVLPATVQAEDFNNGGPGQGYNDTDATNNGGQYRGEQVDIEVTGDTGGGYNVGWITAGEWLTYQINVTTAGNYDFAVRAANPNAGVTYHIEINGVNVSGTQTVPNTGGWQTWTTQTISNIALTTGVKTMKVSMDNGGWNLNYITITGHQDPFGGSARAIPGIIQAEDFDTGGQGVAYNDVEATNIGGAYRTTEGVDITTTADVGGGHIIGWIGAGEWTEYTVNVNTTGDYAVKLRVASAGGGGALHMSIDGVNIFSQKNFADTAGWDTWTTIIVPGVFMTAGNNKILRVTADVGNYNINHMDFAFGGADVVSVDMGNPDVNDGMTHSICCDGNTVPWTIGGHNARANITDADSFYYFTISDAYAFQGNKNNATITFDYFDKNTGTLSLNYDGASNPYTVGPNVTLTNSNTWKTAVWQVGDAYFGNRENGGADFRISYSGVDFYIDTVMVFSTTGVAPPGQASNPNPANGATLVNRNADLSWTAGSGATNRDVRFGTVNPPPFVINQTATTYDPGTMAVNTTYFWRIDEKNAGGTTTGVVWSFTTLPLPGAASAPNPANGATLVAITADPSWTAGSNAASHDVRFGTVNPPPFVVNQAGTTYAAPTLSPNTVYFWRIDEVNTSGTTTGTVWSFTTLPLPGLASAPNPANGATGVATNAQVSWTAGSNATSHNVRFGTANPPPFVQNQAGTTYNPGTLANNTTYFWRIDEQNSSGTTTGTVWSFTTATAPACFSDSFAYANGNLNGNGSWSGSATSQIQILSQAVRINGGASGFDASRTISCTGSGGLITITNKIQSGTGDSTMWSLWFDDPSGINMCRWYGTGTTARGRIGSSGIVTAAQTLTGGLDTLQVKINPTAKTAEFLFNSVSIGVLNYSAQGAANTLGRLRFERVNNSGATGHFLSFDDLTVQ